MKSTNVEGPSLTAALWARAGIILLLLPSLYWIIRDRTIWPWDQAWYGQVSTDLWYWLWHSPMRWAVTMVDGLNLKPPGIVWLGQAFVGLRGLLGSVEASLLLSILVTQFALLYIVYKIGALMFPEEPLIPAAGVVFTAASQLFVALSHQFFVEPMQAVAVAWSLYLCGRVRQWPAPQSALHLVALLVLGALAKATTPMYFLLPVAYTAIHLFRGFRAEAKTDWLRGRGALALLGFIIAGGGLGAVWYLRHIGDVWRHVHDATVGDIALEYGYRESIFRKLATWSSLLSQSFLAPYLSWAFGLALALIIIRALSRSERYNQLRQEARKPVVVLSLLQIVLLLLTFSSTISVDPRYMFAVLPFVAVLVMQICAWLPRRALVALVFVGFGQWIAVNAAAVSTQFRMDSRSEWLKPLQTDPTRFDEVAAAVRIMSKGLEHNSFVAVEEPWLNANSLDFFAAKERLARGTRTYFISIGYAQKDSEAAFRRIAEYHCRYLITLRQPFQNPHPNFLNATALPVLARVVSDPRFSESAFPSRYGLVVYSVDGSEDPGVQPAVSSPPAAILQANPVQGGSSALDSIFGSIRAQDGSFTVARTGVSTCDGWAFDDSARSTPAEVWLELTHSVSGARQYLHAQRYLRPALAAAVKIPSVAGAGFHCDPVAYRLQPGTYTVRIFQLDGGAAKVSGLNTYTPAPRITVP